MRARYADVHMVLAPRVALLMAVGGNGVTIGVVRLSVCVQPNRPRQVRPVSSIQSLAAPV